jgi:hypothetical protein
MKKSLISLQIIAILLLGTVIGSYAQSSQKLDKAQKKECSKLCKQLKAEGWTSVDKSITLDAAVEKFYLALFAGGSNSQRWTYTEPSCGLEAACAAMARQNVRIQYVQQAAEYVQQRMKSELSANSDSNAEAKLEEFQKLYAAYQQIFVGELTVLLKYCVAIEKPVRERVRQYQAWYTVNEADAAQARVRAMKQALGDTGLMQEYAEQLALFVQECFK